MGATSLRQQYIPASCQTPLPTPLTGQNPDTMLQNSLRTLAGSVYGGDIQLSYRPFAALLGLTRIMKDNIVRAMPFCTNPSPPFKHSPGDGLFSQVHQKQLKRANPGAPP